MIRSRSTCLLLIAALFAAGGCRLFRDGAFAPLERPASPELSAVRSQLRKDAWRRNAEWSLIRGTETEATLKELAGRRRWAYGGELATALIGKMDQRDRRGWEADPPGRRSEIGGRRSEIHSLNSQPSTLNRQSPVSNRWTVTADSYLREIAQEDGLAGWNALILLAQRSPERAVRFEPRLRELVEKPVSYDVETGRRATAATPVATEPALKKEGTDDKGSSGTPRPALSKLTIAQLLDLAHDDRPPARSASAPAVWDEVLARWPLVRKKAGEQKRRQTRTVSPAMRLAAAEAWCRVLAAANSDPVDALAPAGRTLLHPKLPAAVGRELTLGLAWHLSPAVIPGVPESLGNPRKDSDALRAARRTAVEACVIHAISLRTVSNLKSPTIAVHDIWPKDIHTRRDDPDPDVRILYGRWAALSGIDEALSILDQQSRLSIDKPVRSAAVVSIGLLGTEPSRKLLHEVSKSATTPMRIAAVKSLAQWGPRELVPFLEDESPGVRQTVAESLRTGVKADSATLAEKLLKDKSPAVQTACLEAIAMWHDRRAVPLLLQAMRHSPPGVSAKAWQALLERRPGLTGYTNRGDERERSEAVDRLVARFALPTDRVWPSLAEISALPVAEQQRLRNAVQRDIAVLVRHHADDSRFRDAVDRLAGLGRDAVEEIEREIGRSQGSYPRRVYRTLMDDVLAKLDPAYAALRDLGRRDQRQRWSAVQKLSDLGQQSSLSKLVVRTLHARIADWPNRAVWQAAMQAVMKDAHPEADELAVAASQIPSPAVQALACEYFRRHPQTQFADRILELMNSRDKTVRLAAIEAAGHCHHHRLIDGTPAGGRNVGRSEGRRSEVGDRRLAVGDSYARFGLRHWATSADRAVADAAVMSLSRLGDETGYRQLHLMSHSGDPKRRRKAYELMGKTGRAQFLSRLIERGLAEKSGEMKKVILNSLEELTAANDRPVGLSRISSYHERIGAWHEWLNRRRDAGSGKVESRRRERIIRQSWRRIEN